MGPKKTVEEEDDIDNCSNKLITQVDKSSSYSAVFWAPLYSELYYRTLTNEGRLACVYIIYTILDIHSHNYYRHLLELALKLWF